MWGTFAQGAQVENDIILMLMRRDNLTSSSMISF